MQIYLGERLPDKNTARSAIPNANKFHDGADKRLSLEQSPPKHRSAVIVEGKPDEGTKRLFVMCLVIH